MADTYFWVPEQKVSRLAAVYEKDEQGNLRKITGQDVVGPGVMNPDLAANIYDAVYPYTGEKKFFSGGAGLTTTVLDYLRVAQMFLNQGELNGVRLLSPLSVELMETDFSNGQPGLLMPEGWINAAGGVVLEDSLPTATIVGEGTFHWGGYYVTRFDIDAENELIYMLITQRTTYLYSDFEEEWAKFRILSHTAIIE
jgi:CubicO group peptidase (beta-lactamase class C family)